MYKTKLRAGKWAFLIITTFFLATKAVAQEGLPVIVLNNGAANTVNSWVVDPDSLRGNYPIGNTTMVLTGPPGSYFGIFLDSFKKRSDFDTLRIHDGNSLLSPVLTYFTSYTFGGPQPPRSVRSSSNVITIYFHAHNDIPLAGVGWRLGVRSITDPGGEMPSFLPVFQTDLTTGAIDLADYDNDNDKDVLINGQIFQNMAGDDSMYMFNRMLQPIGSWTSSNMKSADFNADGFKDVFIVGESNLSGTYAATAALFKNNGNNTFTRITIPGMPNAGRGSCAITDVNGDGRPDITYSASVNLTPAGAVCKIFLNNGSFSFTELANNLPGLMASSMDWFDYDADGDPDLVMNGYNATGSLSGLYKNNGGGAFTPVSMPPFFATSSGMVQWVDANGDGRMDFMNTGVTTPGNVNGIVPELLINNGGDNFTRLITNMPARAISFIDGYDYDRDGDADFVYSGLIPSTPSTDVAVYKNNGSGNFTRVAYRTNVQCLSTVKWIDINADNRKDLFVCGRTENNPSYVLMNMDADSFRLASYPFVSYSNTSGQNVLVEDLNNDGLPDFMFAGPLDDQDCAEGNSSALILSESWKRKPFTGFTNVFDFRSIPGSAVTANSFWRWGDVDNDGKKDVILTKNNEPLRVFKNNGGNNFSLLYSGRINSAKSYDQCGVVDIDNDGTNELYVTPNKLYKWNGSSFTTLYEATGIGCEGQLLITCDGYFDFGDYNKDGFTDVVFVQGGFVYVLRNNGTGRFVNDYPSYLDALGTPDASATQVRWMDYDGDGDADLFTREGIYEATSWGGLRFRGEPLQDFGNIGFGDINKDGKIDAVSFIRSPPNLGPGHIFYNQQGSSFFKNLTPANFIQSYGSSYFTGVSISDLDNDGDLDIIYGTGGSCTNNGVYLNRASETYRNITVVKPNGGEVYAGGTTLPIRWTGHLLSNTVKIELSVNNGISYSTIVAAAPGNANGGLYNWLINTSPSSQCKIRVTDNVTGTITDSSNFNFTITAATSLPDIIRSNDLKIYPNPANNIAYCLAKGIPAGRKVQLKIFDTNGRELYSTETNMGTGNIVPVDISSLSGGYYIVQVRYNTMVYSQKLIKAR